MALEIGNSFLNLTSKSRAVTGIGGTPYTPQVYGESGSGTSLAARMEQYDYNQPNYTNTDINSRYDAYSKKHVPTNFDVTG